MKILNCIGQPMYKINHKIKEKVVFCADHMVDDEVLKQASIGLELLGKLFDNLGIEIQTLRETNVFFSELGNINLSMDDSTLGNVFQMIVIKSKKVSQYEPIKILAIIVEELCHHFFQIHDERIVKYKVLEVIKQKYPSLEIEDIFDMDTI